MASHPSAIQMANENRLKGLLQKSGYENAVKLTDSLQGSIWRAINKTTKDSVVIKATQKNLHQHGIVIINGMPVDVEEDIIKETAILKYLTEFEFESESEQNHDKQTKKAIPNSFVKYIDSFQTNHNYYLVMEDGGHPLFNFIAKAHEFINSGQITVAEWHRFVKIVFKQMIEFTEFIHSNNICHYDISLENFLINDVDVEVVPTLNSSDDGEDMMTTTEQLRFCTDNVQVKACDFGLAEYFGDNSTFQTSKYCGKTNYQSPEISAKKRSFNAKSNDIFCLGVCLFMMILGGSPWTKSSMKCRSFRQIINGDLITLLKKWNRLHYVNKDLLTLFQSIFKFEEERCTLSDIKNCEWLKESDSN